VIRIVIVYDPEFNDLPPLVQEFDTEDLAYPENVSDALTTLLIAPDVSSFSVQRVTPWWPATWQQLTPGCEVLGDDGATWVVSRGISELSPHEVEIYRFGQPETRFTFTPQYDQAVQARMTQESSMRALLMTELGARLVDDGG
jgi:hypothetical protein